MSESIRLSEKHGIQPTIPLCPICGEEKNEIALLGAAGDKLAEEPGHADGAMPMHAHIPGDLEPCDKCKERGVAIYVVNIGTNKVVSAMLVRDELITRLLKPGEQRDAVLKRRIMFIDEATAADIGLLEGGA